MRQVKLCKVSLWRVKLYVYLAVTLLLLLVPITRTWATPEYAEKTGKTCGSCHVDPAGGSTLTKAGEDYRNSLAARGLYKPATKAQHAIRFIVGYVHMLTAIAWFGAILYVHLLLKPAYASRGLPKGELLLGWYCIIVMAVTGTLLTLARVPSLHVMFHSKFGILLTVKIALFLAMVITASLTTFVIGPRMRKCRPAAVQQSTSEFTVDDLARFDGREGRPAYIGYAENVYDVSGSKLWNNGGHMRKHQAGADLTEILKTAPHTDELVLKMPLMGKLVKKTKEQHMPRHLSVFYFFAYFNLVMVFLIVLVVSMWRWW
ncbi:MAG: CopD family protein [Nitrospirae bacterium]|nr:CopD family protein [Nitrospirota bacterium]